MQNIILDVDRDKIWKESESYFLKICGFQREKEDHEERIEEAFAIRANYKEKICPHMLLSVYSGSCVQEDSFVIGTNKIACDLLGRIKQGNIKYVCLYAMCMDEIATKTGDMLEQFYLDTWMTALLDAGRDWLKEYLKEQLKRIERQEVYVTDSFGPGFYGMGMENVPQIMEILEGERIGMVYEKGSIHPSKSNLGFYLGLIKEQSVSVKDCRNCLSDHKNCMFCKNYK